jgi:NAD-dependent deacetylase
MRIVVFSGAGISAESGIRTFRDAGGLWEGHRVEDVASPEGWRRNPELVLDFYNQRRLNLLQSQPNAAHLAIAALEQQHEVLVITQNVDDLHERAGSTRVTHLHGELMYARSSGETGYRQRLDEGLLHAGMRCPEGHPLRPDIVWFGEAVPMMDEAVYLTSRADAMLIVGTSLQVYPAADLLNYAPHDCGIWLVDPNRHQEKTSDGIRCISAPATIGVPLAIAEINEQFKSGGPIQ